MRIAIDFDGTIADTNSLKSKWVSVELGEVIPPYLCDRTSLVPIIGEANYEQMCQTVYSEASTARLVPIEGSYLALKEMSQQAQIHLFTARNESFPFALDWLARNRFSKYLHSGNGPMHGTKLQACLVLGINLLIDDDSRHLPPTSDSSVQGILFKYGAPSSYRLGELEICRSWNEARGFAKKVADRHSIAQ